MLKKEFKLKSLEINNLLNKKETPFKIKRGVFFDVKIFLTNDKFKSAIIISSKLFKKAKDRNKIRRQIYSILENMNKERDIFNTYIFYPKKEINNTKFQDLIKEVYNI